MLPECCGLKEVMYSLSFKFLFVYSTTAEVSQRHFGTDTKKVRHLGTKDIVPNCLRSEVS